MLLRRITAGVLVLGFSTQSLFAQALSDSAPIPQSRMDRHQYDLLQEQNMAVQSEGGLGEFRAGYYPGAVMVPIHLWGAMKTTGLFRVPKNTTLTQLLSYARGPQDDARLAKVHIKRIAEAKEKSFTVDVEKILDNPGVYDTVLQPNDIVYVEPRVNIIDPGWIVVVSFVGALLASVAAGFAIRNNTR